MDNRLSRQEKLRRKTLSDQARAIIVRALPIEESDETSVMLSHAGFYLQIAFSPLHPLMVIYLARGMDRTVKWKDVQRINGLNLKCVLGSHAINEEAGCYSYRSAQWIDTNLTEERFLEIFGRCVEEAIRGFNYAIGP